MASDDSVMGSGIVPRDEYSVLLRSQQDNPEAVVKTSSVDMADFYGNAVTWTIKTIRIEGRDTVFLQCNNASGGTRLVLPSQVTSVMARHRDSIWRVNRKRAGVRVMADRMARGERPVPPRKKAKGDRG